jgi:hypothetical protein
MATQLLTRSNPKVLKGTAQGYLTWILHLAPADLSGHNVCSRSSAGCRAACLNLSGHGGMFRPGETTNVVLQARIRRTQLFFAGREEFMRQLVAEIRNAIKYAARHGLTPAFRLNGTSDLAWEKYSLSVDGVEYDNVFAAFPHVQFYDYTAIIRRKVAGIGNYHLTFSAKEDNDADVAVARAAGMNVAMVFDIAKRTALPSVWTGVPVYNGDDSDLRFLDPAGVIVGLYTKGNLRLRAAARASGFARRVIPLLTAA